jgi:hypothetical protein
LRKPARCSIGAQAARDGSLFHAIQSPLSRETEEATWPLPRNLGRGG